MLRMDLLLNPGSPPSSPARSEQFGNQVAEQISGELVVEPTLVEQVVGALPSQRVYEPSKPPGSPSSVPAVKRLKRDLPALRLLLDSAVDNQRDDAPHEIFSGHAFWGQVPSLNPTPSPSDISQLGTSSSLPSADFMVSGNSSTRGERSATPLLPSLPMVITSMAAATQDVPTDDTESAAPSEDGDTLVQSEVKYSTTSSGNVGKKKKITICKEDGCSSQALSKQLCMKHGGGPRCSVPDCNNGAKLRNLCFQHGGSTICLADGCSSKAKRFGYCWSHGGGRICGEKGCDKVAAQGGMCWAHGGGNRCKLEGCTKRSYKQHGYYCKRHAEVSADY